MLTPMLEVEGRSRYWYRMRRVTYDHCYVEARWNDFGDDWFVVHSGNEETCFEFVSDMVGETEGPHPHVTLLKPAEDRYHAQWGLSGRYLFEGGMPENASTEDFPRVEAEVVETSNGVLWVKIWHGSVEPQNYPRIFEKVGVVCVLTLLGRQKLREARDRYGP